MKKLLPFLLVLFSGLAFGQPNRQNAKAPVKAPQPSLSATGLKHLKLMEDTLQALGEKFTYDSLLDERKKACYTFIPKLVQALKTENSFYYPFDSLETMAKVYAPDSSFRIFTWQLVLPKGHFRYYGVMQMRSSQLKIFPLYDLSDTMTYHSQLVTTNDNWYGCLYYNIIARQVDKKQVYTLFGYEAADVITRRKVLDILTFDDKGKPKFGAPVFYVKYEEDSMHYKRVDTFSRFFIEYKYNAPTVFNYDANMGMIVFDHVAPPNDKAKGATFSYVPDGTYEGFLWHNNRWDWVEKVFTFGINEMDNPPVPAPLFGDPKRQPELPTEDVKPK